MKNENGSEDDTFKGFLESEFKYMNIFELLDPVSIDLSARRYISSKLQSERLNLQDWRRKTKQRAKSIDLTLQRVFFKETTKLEKIFYPFTLMNIFLVGLIMGKFPEWFHIYYSCLLCLLMPIRFYTYYKANNHYYMADLCYFVNFICLVYIWICPESVNLYQSCFAFCFGSLSFAVITWRNSIVMHSVDKITSCFIHIIPPCTFYIIHHGLSREYQLERFPAAVLSLKHNEKYWDFKYNVIWTSFYYLIWQTLYHFFITLRKSSKIKSGERMTSFRYFITHQFKDSFIAKLPEPYPVIIFTLCQYCYQLMTMSLCGIWFHYKFAAASFLSCIYLFAAHNGATYYIDYYGTRFNKELLVLRQELKALQEQNNKSLNSATTETEVPSEKDESSMDSNEFIQKKID